MIYEITSCWIPTLCKMNCAQDITLFRECFLSHFTHSSRSTLLHLMSPQLPSIFASYKPDICKLSSYQFCQSYETGNAASTCSPAVILVDPPSCLPPIRCPYFLPIKPYLTQTPRLPSNQSAQLTQMPSKSFPLFFPTSPPSHALLKFFCPPAYPAHEDPPRTALCKLTVKGCKQA